MEIELNCMMKINLKVLKRPQMRVTNHSFNTVQLTHTTMSKNSEYCNIFCGKAIKM